MVRSTFARSAALAAPRQISTPVAITPAPVIRMAVPPLWIAFDRETHQQRPQSYCIQDAFMSGLKRRFSETGGTGGEVAGDQAVLVLPRNARFVSNSTI